MNFRLRLRKKGYPEKMFLDWSKLRNADLRLVFTDRVSTLPLLSKVFEKIMYYQLYIYMNNFLNELLCGFRKAHSTQHALFKLLQAWQKELGNSGFIGSILVDLSKAYDCLLHDLLIAKLGAYGLDRPSLIINGLS